MKRIISMALVLVMSLCVSAPAFASESAFAGVPTKEIIMPRVSLLSQTLYKTNTAETDPVTANPEDGDYLRYYYRNDSDYDCLVHLIRIDGTRQTIVGSMPVPKNDRNQDIFFRAGAGSGTYKIKVENTENGGLVSGHASLAQYHDLVDMT